MTPKKIFIFIVLLVVVGFIIAGTRGLKIESVIDGSTVRLNNGAIVSLIGIEPSVESQTELSSYVGESVEILPDGSQFFDTKRMEPATKYPAYVLLTSGGNINSKLLISGAAKLH